jgi:hypothetical protein
MTEYKWLHSKEKEALQECGRDMHRSVEGLVNACSWGLVSDKNYAASFTEPRNKLNVIYKELCFKERYLDEVNRSEYAAAKEALATGRTQLASGKAEIPLVGVYDNILERANVCETLMGKYMRIWEAIRAFDSKEGGSA